MLHRNLEQGAGDINHALISSGRIDTDRQHAKWGRTEPRTGIVQRKK
jgi:hypothetical protein